MGGVTLKACKSCMLVKYCKRNHWLKHKKLCKQRAAELRDEALFKDPPAKEECPICFIPMPNELICCISLPPATISSVPIRDFANANEELAKMDTEEYYSCCGKSICKGCVNSCRESGNIDKCPFCNSDRCITSDKAVEEIRKRTAANDASSTNVLACCYYFGKLGLLRDREKAIERYTRAAELGNRKAHFALGVYYNERGDLKRAKFHFEAAAVAGHEVARCNIGTMENNSGNMGQAVKHWTIAASAGYYTAMHYLLFVFNQGHVSRETLTAYNNSCPR